MQTYALIVIPPPEIISFVDGYRKRFAKYTDYIIPPHFTIYPPFYNDFSSEPDLIEKLITTFSKIMPAQIALSSINYFEGVNNVAFFEPSPDSSSYLIKLLTEATNGLKGKVKNVYEDYNFSPEKYKPHMTIAEKIPEDKFRSIKNELNKIQVNSNFISDCVYLYKQVDDSPVWSEVIKLPLGG
jgi:2'-5' RNA ligase